MAWRLGVRLSSLSLGRLHFAVVPRKDAVHGACGIVTRLRSGGGLAAVGKRRRADPLTHSLTHSSSFSDGEKSRMARTTIVGPSSVSLSRPRGSNDDGDDDDGNGVRPQRMVDGLFFSELQQFESRTRDGEGGDLERRARLRYGGLYRRDLTAGFGDCRRESAPCHCVSEDHGYTVRLHLSISLSLSLSPSDGPAPAFLLSHDLRPRAVIRGGTLLGAVTARRLGLGACCCPLEGGMLGGGFGLCDCAVGCWEASASQKLLE